MTWARSNVFARLGAFLVLTAFLARAVFAAGYMPEINTQTGELTISVCTNGGEHRTVKVDVPMKPAKTDPSQHCPFAQAGVTILPEPATFAKAAEAYVFAAALIEKSQHISLDVRLAHAPPTGPPALI